MMKAAELKQWLESLPEGAEVAIDEGGMTLFMLDAQERIYIEVGGAPYAVKTTTDAYDAEQDEFGDPIHADGCGCVKCTGGRHSEAPTYVAIDDSMEA